MSETRGSIQDISAFYCIKKTGILIVPSPTASCSAPAAVQIWGTGSFAGVFEVAAVNGSYSGGVGEGGPIGNTFGVALFPNVTVQAALE